MFSQSPDLPGEARFMSRRKSLSINASSLWVRIAGDSGGMMSMAMTPKAMPARMAIAPFQNP
jgi:hypothetical protein